ncbi:TetR/AcrR family transcriptional regulator [Microbacterium sp. zg-Y818]|uniref:TetR/AcrR family transcriptional regulator n=1 Tax=unclassified Microbacterium TaxID=2609290 RepID=UPI00214B6D3A|nr:MULTISPECIES: TetR/AcrR family transcriptional regulator [unclassified Microbacterium]MCR2799293.1 TetR/AcrR family transcriptional regulator [Microbacterium sp. zg.Y818]WIM21295.1 TetR/AcrR family transcriptional regulator [Microbacterium sp. zg-Y818]
MSEEIADEASFRGRGRPSVIDAERIAEAAIALWRERGFRTTGWKDIAEVTGVSVRTLMRHFGSRAEIPWTGVDAAAQRLAISLAAMPDDVPTGEALRRAIVDSVTHSEQVFRVAPDWLAVVANEPDLMVAAPRAYAPWTVAIAVFIAHRHPEAPPATCRALATAFQSATFAALGAWVEEGAREDPDRAVDRVLGWLDVSIPTAADGGHPEPGPVGEDGVDTRTQENKP